MTNSNFAETSMGGQPPGPRQIVAHPPFAGSKMAGKTMAIYKNPVKLLVFIVVAVAAIVAFSLLAGTVFGGIVGSHTGPAAEAIDHLLRWGSVALIIGGSYLYYRWHSGKKILISLTGGGLTVDKWPGDVFSPRDAQLGPWTMPGGGMSMGTVLHLQSGAHRFALGVRDHRPAAGTRLTAAPDYNVDAWVWARDFGDGLAMFAGERAGSGAMAPQPGAPMPGPSGQMPGPSGPVPGGPARCVLYPNPMLMQQMGAFAFRKKQKLYSSTSQAQLAIDLRDNGMYVLDPNTNALIASAALATVTATPAFYKPSFGFGRFVPLNAEALISNAVAQTMSIQPVLVINVPGSQPLAIGCSDSTNGFSRRFSWRGDAPRSTEPPPYVASGSDWQLLVETLRLAQYLEISG